MTSITFDTHKFVKHLQSKGISEEQSEAIIDVVIDVQNAAIKDFHTKSDSELFKSELRHDFQLLKVDIENKIQSLEQRVVVKLGVMIGIATAFLATIQFFQ